MPWKIILDTIIIYMKHAKMIFPKDCIRDKVMSHLDNFNSFSKRVLGNNYNYIQRYIKFFALYVFWKCSIEHIFDNIWYLKGYIKQYKNSSSRNPNTDKRMNYVCRQTKSLAAQGANWWNFGIAIRLNKINCLQLCLNNIQMLSNA